MIKVKSEAIIYYLIAMVTIHATALCQDTSIGRFDINKVISAAKKDIIASPGKTEDTIARNGKNELLKDNYFIVLLKSMGFLVIVIIIIAGFLWLIKKTGLNRVGRGASSTKDIIETLPTGQNKCIHLIRIMDIVYVIAQTPQNMTLIDTIEHQKAVELIASAKGGTSIVHFKDIFNKFLDKIKKAS